MSEKPFLYSLLNTYLENRIQNKYPINHEESNRSGFPDAADTHLCVGGCGRKTESRYSLNICERGKPVFRAPGTKNQNSSSLITRHPRGCFQKGSNQQQATKPKLTHVTLYMWWLSEEERRVDALALRAEERRDKLRKAAGRSKYPLIRRCLNGETRQSKPLSSIRQSITYGGEPGELKHLSSRRKRKKHRYRE